MPRRRTGLLVIATSLWLSACEGPTIEEPRGPRLSLAFEVIENRWDPTRGDMFSAMLTMKNTGSTPLGDGWTLYFNFQRDVVSESLPGELVMTRIAGDFQSLAPSDSWLPLAAGDSLRFRFEGLWPVTKVTDAPVGAYLMLDRDADRGAAIPVPVAVGAIAPPAGGHPEGRPVDQPLIPTAESRFRENERVASRPAEQVGLVLPTPVRFQRVSGAVALDSSWVVAFEPQLRNEAGLLSEALGGLFGSVVRTSDRPAGAVDDTATVARTIFLELGSPVVSGVARAEGAEAYVLSVTADRGVRVVGSDAAGVLYGVETLRALLPVEAYRGGATALTIPQVIIEDAPRFAYRGLHLDVARNFQTRETVEKLLRVMAFYKLNRFHFHVTDDEGWRFEVPSLPELTDVGSRRGHTLDGADRLVPSFGSGAEPDLLPGSGHYSRAELIEILRLAARLHIQVIPEIDGPGHARAAVKSMEARYRRLRQDNREEEAHAFLLTDPTDSSRYRSVQGWSDNVMNPCLESTYAFLDEVFGELQSVYAEAGAELGSIHIGGDEVPAGVWRGSPACDAYLAARPEVGGAGGLFTHFVDRVSSLLQSRGLSTAGWEEIALESPEAGGGKQPSERLLERGVVPYVWNNVWRGGAEDLGYRLANAGYPVVLANATNLYLDLAYDRDPLEPGFTWAGLTSARTAYEFVPLDLFKSAREDLAGRPIAADAEFRGRVRPTERGRRNILGIQGQLWGENAITVERLEYLAFPKLLGLAERAWAAEAPWERIAGRAERDAALEQAWGEFASRIGHRELPRLDYLEGGVAYRLPPPGAVVEGGTLRANVPFPGLQIRYTTDGSEPTATSTLYEGPVSVTGEVRLRVFDTKGRGGREARVNPRGDVPRG